MTSIRVSRILQQSRDATCHLPPPPRSSTPQLQDRVPFGRAQRVTRYLKNRISSEDILLICRCLGAGQSKYNSKQSVAAAHVLVHTMSPGISVVTDTGWICNKPLPSLMTALIELAETIHPTPQEPAWLQCSRRREQSNRCS